MMRSGSYPSAASCPRARRPAARNAAVMPRASHSPYDAWPTPIATAHPRTRAATTSRSSRVGAFGPRPPRRWAGGGTSAATVTGPAHAPRPTSSRPTTTCSPAPQHRRSSRRDGVRVRDAGVAPTPAAGTGGADADATIAGTYQARATPTRTRRAAPFRSWSGACYPRPRWSRALASKCAHASTTGGHEVSRSPRSSKKATAPATSSSVVPTDRSSPPCSSTTSYARRRSARCGGSRSRDPLTDGLQALDQLFDGDRLEGGGPHRAPRGQHDRGAGHRRLVRRLDHVEEVVLAHEGVLGDDLQAHSLDLASDLPDALGVLADGRPAVGPQRGEHGVRRHPVSLLAVAGRGAY